MLRKRILCLGLVSLVLFAAAGSIAGVLPDEELVGWAAALGTLVLAAWVFIEAATASRQLQVRRLRGTHARARQKLLALVRELRDASAAAARARAPHEAPRSARAAWERLSQTLLGFHLGRAGWDPLARDLSQLRLAIRTSHAMLQMRPEQLRLVGSPFRFLQEHCEELLARHAPVASPGSAPRPLKSGTLA
jgi:hypothetical protein